MTTPLGVSHKRAWASLLLAHAAATRKIDAALRAEGHPSVEVYDVLLALEEAEEHRMRMVDLADEVIYSPSGLTRLIDRMEASNLVARRSCPSDRRAIYVELTPEGRASRESAWPRYSELIHEHFGKWLGDEEAECIARGLQRVREGEGLRRRCRGQD